MDIQLCTFLDLGTRWKLVVSFVPLPLVPIGKEGLGRPQIRSGRCGERKEFLASAGGPSLYRLSCRRSYRCP
jgi:hypothetical protein